MDVTGDLPAGPELVFTVRIADASVDPGDVSVAAPRLVRQIAAPSVSRQVAAQPLYRQDRAEENAS